MRKSVSIFLFLAIAAILLLLAFKAHRNLAAGGLPNQPVHQETNSAISLPPASNQKGNGLNSENQYYSVEIADRYRQGQIGKAEAMRELALAENQTSQDFYGKAVDQYGQPVVGAEVSANLVLNSETNEAMAVKNCTNVTDDSGLFQFTNLRGADLNVQIGKSGYIWGSRGEGFQKPATGKTSPQDRAVLTLWKIHGTGPLTSSELQAKIPSNGTATRFDISTGKTSSNGDLQVALARSPLEVRRGRDKFDWTLDIEIPQGGVTTENDPYPYWAPDSGYQPKFEVSVSSNDVPWTPSLTTNLYIKNSQGQYGRMQVKIYAALTPARIECSFSVNPSGSQSLEPDFSKEY